MAKPPKAQDIMAAIRESLEAGRYRYVSHASERLQQREVTRLEVKQVLRRGHHERRKDQFKEEHGGWNYSIRGKTIDSRTLRIVISFDENDMLIITVIELMK